MSDVEFNEPQYQAQRPQDKKRSVLSRFMISLGLAKDEPGAQRALAISAAVIVIVAILVYLIWGR